jgi:iron complex outermembrane receptor protein
MALAMAFPLMAAAQSPSEPEQKSVLAAADAPVKSLGVVTVVSGQPTSLPTQIPTTIEGVTREQIEATVNAYDSEDALKYFPSLLVRKRYIGDYNHAMLSSRATGTGNSPRSMVYADGIPLSNLLGSGTGTLSFAPRWNMVTPEEIARVDVMYGPFSAAYPGNSVGAVVDYVTRMPEQFEAHVKLDYSIQPFKIYNTDQTFNGGQGSASLGNKNGDWSWFINMNRTDSHGQPLSFATRLQSTGVAPTTGTVVTGAVLDRNNANQPWYILGTGTEYHSIQDHVKTRIAYDISSTLKASYVLGVWQNNSENRPVSYLKDSSGNPVYSGPIVINGQQFAALTGGDFALNNESLMHVMHGFSLKSNTQGLWDWEVNASLYDYTRDEKRANSAANTLPAAISGGSGTIADGRGSGWNTLGLKGTWRPEGIKGEHIMDMGVQQDSGQLSYTTYNIAGNWLNDRAGSVASSIGGKTRLQSAYAQDTWNFAPKWKTVLGLRAEQWSAFDGQTNFTASSSQSFGRRDEFSISPKAALLHQWSDDTVIKASLGRAVRNPTLQELYGATSTTNSQFINDPNLKAEKSWTTELSLEKDLGHGLLRATLFAEETRDSIYSQITFDSTLNGNISRVTNVDRILTKGLELAYTGFDVGVKGLDLNGSITYAQSLIIDNTGFVVTPGDTIGKWQPNIPQWRASFLSNYRVDEKWNVAWGARYSGVQYRTLNNSDVYGYTYQGASEYFTTDLRIRYKVDKNWTAAFGIDNLNNYQYWNFHPYPQRNYTFELKWDL